MIHGGMIKQGPSRSKEKSKTFVGGSEERSSIIRRLLVCSSLCVKVLKILNPKLLSDGRREGEV